MAESVWGEIPVAYSIVEKCEQRTVSLPRFMRDTSGLSDVLSRRCSSMTYFNARKPYLEPDFRLVLCPHYSPIGRRKARNLL